MESRNAQSSLKRSTTGDRRCPGSRPPRTHRFQTDRNDALGPYHGRKAVTGRTRTAEGSDSAPRASCSTSEDLATARGNELRATVDYNKSLSNLAGIKPRRSSMLNLRRIANSDDRVWGRSTNHATHRPNGGSPRAFSPSCSRSCNYASPLELGSCPSISSLPPILCLCPPPPHLRPHQPFLCPAA